ncbi:hypothetical protein QR685DRAFT_574473 [Neurospora intermedia]|uniref:Secreted protein n=1 Tax=Neurospora intermedia TaxID=5142 RepID=A0ABR3D799_NEUIN
MTPVMSDLCTIASCYLATLPCNMLTVTKSVCLGSIPGTHRHLCHAAHDGKPTFSFARWFKMATMMNKIYHDGLHRILLRLYPFDEKRR